MANSIAQRIKSIRGEKVAHGGSQVGLAERFGILVPLSAWIILCVYFSIMNPAFFTMINFLNIVRQSSVLLVVSLAGTWIILMGAIDLSVAAVLTLGSICTAMAVTLWGPLGVFVALGIGIIAGLFNGFLNAYAKLPSFLVTLGSSFMFTGIGLIICKGRPQPWNSELIMNLMGGTIGTFPKIGLWALATWLICIFLFHKTRFGRYIVAIGDGERTARMSGVPVDKVKLKAFSLSGLLSGFAGTMFAVRMASGAPGMGAPYLLDSIAAIVLGGTALTGGVGGPSRTIFGVLVIVTLSNGMTILHVDPFYQVAIRGAVVIAAVAMTMRRMELAFVK